MSAWFRIAWLAGLGLAVAASWAIWQYAPIAVPEQRFAACLVPLVLLGLIPVIFARRITKAPSGIDTPSFRAQRKSALTFLANRGLAGRRARLSVPLYLVIGAPGAGKSSLLERSGLGLGAPVTIADATWWVGEDAIFVETSIGAPDQGLRQTCEIVKSLRPSLPINGTVFVLSPTDLTLADQAEHREIAEGAVSALREIQAATGQAAPFYLMLSKIDLLPGFQEFFGRQEPQERSQPWGFTLPQINPAAAPSPTAMGDAIATGFQSLVAAMRARLVEWLSREADPVRCARINGFGAQIASLQTTVLEKLFTGGRGTRQDGPLRGVFLTSARQEALSIDGLLPDLSRRFAMPRIGMIPPDLGLDDEEHGYFISGAFRNTIFKEAGLAGAGQRSRAGSAIRWAAVAAFAIICAGTGYFVLRSYNREIAYAARGTEIVVGAKPIASPATVADLSSILTEMRRFDEFGSSLQGGQSVRPFEIGLSAQPKLKAAVDTARDHFRRNALMPNLVAMLETELVDLNASVETLKERVALAGASGAVGPAMNAWLQAQAATLPEADRAFFISESQAAVGANGGLAVDPAYLDAARRIIAYKESLS